MRTLLYFALCSALLLTGCKQPEERVTIKIAEPQVKKTIFEPTVADLDGLIWMNEPRSYSLADGILKVVAEKGTDYFNNPEDGSVNGTAPFLYRKIDSNFVATTLVRPDFGDQWNAVSLMMIIDEKHWIKFAFENSDATGKSIVTVVTREVSDDANGVVLNHTDTVWLRMIRKGDIYSMLWSLDGEDFKMARLAKMPKAGSVMIGVEAQCPVGEEAVHDILRFEVEERTVADLRKGE
ncbi:MAG: DUF1349 domain-containing protein [Flavobacteriaceae bacterium]|nr:DUF1349 domain-containing protein [Flavobacteriaceae bacterium]